MQLPRAPGTARPCAPPSARPRTRGALALVRHRRVGAARALAMPSASADGSSGRTRTPVSPSTTSSGSELTFDATTGSPASIASRTAEAEALPARRVHEQRRAAQPGGDVRHAARQEDALVDTELVREPAENITLRAFAEHDEHRVVRKQRQRADRDVEALLRCQARDREQDARIRRGRRRAGCRPTPPAGRPCRSGSSRPCRAARRPARR